MIEEERLFDQISNYISPGDFTEATLPDGGGLLYEQRKEGGLNPAKILNHFTGEEEHREVASLFNTRIRELSIQRKSVNRLSVKRY